MPFQKGHKLAKGRTKGSENKEKKALREMITILIEKNQEKFKKEMNKLSGVQYIDRFISLIEYVIPKLNRTDLTNDGKAFGNTDISDNELISKLEGINKALNGQREEGDKSTS